MFVVFIVALIIAVVTATKILEEDFHRPAITMQMVEEINVSASTRISHYFSTLYHGIKSP